MHMHTDRDGLRMGYDDKTVVTAGIGDGDGDYWRGCNWCSGSECLAVCDKQHPSALYSLWLEE